MRRRTREVWLLGVAAAALVLLIGTNLQVWVENLEHAPREMRPVLRDSTRLAPITQERSTYRKRFLCPYFIRERLQGRSLSLPQELEELQWRLRWVADLEVQRTSHPVELTTLESLLVFALEHEIVLCQDHRLRLIASGHSKDYVATKTSIGTYFIVPRELLNEVRERGADATRVICDLLAPEHWSFGDPLRGKVRWGGEVEIAASAEEKPFFMQTGGSDRVKRLPATVPCHRNFQGALALETDVEIEGDVRVQLYVWQFDDEGLVSHSSYHLGGNKKILVVANETTESHRISLRIAGTGTVHFRRLGAISPKPAWYQYHDSR